MSNYFPWFYNTLFDIASLICFYSLCDNFRSYYKSFIPFIIWYSDNQSLEYCAVLLQFGINQLLTTCLSNILIHLLPYSADAETGKNVINDAKGKTAVNKALIFLDSKLSKQVKTFEWHLLIYQASQNVVLKCETCYLSSFTVWCSKMWNLLFFRLHSTCMLL